MLGKILITLIVVLAALYALRLVGLSGPRQAKRTEDAARDAVRARMKQSADLVKCRSCGAYHEAKTPCDCTKGGAQD